LTLTLSSIDTTHCSIPEVAEGKDAGDPSTLEDPVALDAIRELIEVTRQ
jgi:hypothetical protein